MSQTPGWNAPGGWGPAPPPLAPGSPWAGPPVAPRPGVVPLRPLGLGEILDASITYIRRNPRATLGLAAGVAVVSGVIQVLILAVSASNLPSLEETSFDASGGSGDSSLAINLASTTQTVIGVFLTLVATGMLTFVMSQSVLGRPVTARSAWDRVKQQIWPLIGLMLLTTLIVLGAFVACLVPGLLLLLVGATLPGALLLVLGVIGGVVVGVWLYVVLLLAPPALILERRTISAALRRSRELVQGAFWRVLGITLLATVLANIISSIVLIPFAIGGIGAGILVGDSADGTFIGALFGSTVGAAAGMIVTLPFSAGVTSLLYIDRRMRREGLDLELQRAVATSPGAPSTGPATGPTGPTAPAAPAAPTEPQRPPTQQW